MLCIAGFDPTGGAGLLADVRSLTAIAVRCMGVVTALTTQRPRGRARVFPVDIRQLSLTFTELTAELPPDAIKIGMLGEARVAATVARLLKKTALKCPIVLDPVLKAGGGDE